MDKNTSAFAKYNQNSLSKKSRRVKNKSKKRRTSESVDPNYGNKKKCHSIKSNPFVGGSVGASTSHNTLNSSSVVRDNVVGLKQNGLPGKGKKLLAKKIVGVEDECPTLVDVGRPREEGETDFTEKSEKVTRWMISPLGLAQFFETYWENKPLHIRRNNKSYYKHLLTTQRLDEILRKNALYYTRNVDVVSYVNGERQTHNPEGTVRAMPVALWDAYNDGCSVRVLNPQTYCGKLHVLVTTLQEYFGAMVGANLYLTPPDSQGFAPHYDDIEAFVLQLEGRKHWTLYAPIKPSEVLPRYSSKNFDRTELGPPIKKVVLEAGDMLYFPRGIIHEGRTDAEEHSLHITVSVYQKTCYADLMEHVLKDALKEAIEKDVDFRRGLPLQYLKHTGLVNRDSKSSVRTEVVKHINTLTQKLLNYIQPDSAADQLGKQFMWDAMPPVATEDEKQCTIHCDGDHMSDGRIINRVEIELDTQVRLLRYHCLRLVKEDNVNRIYYCTDNGKVYHEEEQMSLEIGEELVPAVNTLIHAYPKYISVDSLPVGDDAKLRVATDLWSLGLLVTEHPLPVIDDE